MRKPFLANDDALIRRTGAGQLVRAPIGWETEYPAEARSVILKMAIPKDYVAIEIKRPRTDFLVFGDMQDQEYAETLWRDETRGQIGAGKYQDVQISVESGLEARGMGAAVLVSVNDLDCWMAGEAVGYDEEKLRQAAVEWEVVNGVQADLDEFREGVRVAAKSAFEAAFAADAKGFRAAEDEVLCEA
jgi:hypothetical protein